MNRKMYNYYLIFPLLFTSLAAQFDESIIIIGAGLSGFSAARRLMEKGYTNIKILEATDREGGRILSIPFSVGYVDMGAQWIHGQTNNIIYEMSNKEGLSFGSTKFDLVDPYFRYSNGTQPSQENYSKLYAISYGIINSIDKLSNPQGNILDYFNAQYDAKTATLNIDSRIIKIMKEEFEKNIKGYFAASDSRDISLKVNSEESKASGDQYVTWKAQGYKTFFDVLSKNYDIRSKIQFNKPVKKIKYNVNDPAGKVTVTCCDGSSHQATHVIFTPSLGVLKAMHEQIFDPALPAKKVLEINSRGVGNLGKFFMEFDSPFWKIPNEEFLGITPMWIEEDRVLAKSLDREWLFGIVAAYGVDGFDNVLEIFLAGHYVLAFELTDQAKIVTDVIWWLERFVPDVKPIPSPNYVAKTNWLTDSNFRGSYSYPSIKEDINNVRTSDLAEPINNVDGKPILLFAGEATDTKYPSMAHGAVNSGFRVADEIHSYYQV